MADEDQDCLASFIAGRRRSRLAQDMPRPGRVEESHLFPNIRAAFAKDHHAPELIAQCPWEDS